METRLATVLKLGLPLSDLFCDLPPSGFGFRVGLGSNYCGWKESCTSLYSPKRVWQYLGILSLLGVCSEKGSIAPTSSLHNISLYSILSSVHGLLGPSFGVPRSGGSLCRVPCRRIKSWTFAAICRGLGLRV